MPTTRVKICGLSTPDSIQAAAKAGAALVGFVFFPKSPRNVTPEQAKVLASTVPGGISKVGLVVNPSDEDLDRITAQVPLDMLQLHGKEDPRRVAEIKARTGLEVMKALSVSTAEDLKVVQDFLPVVDQLLFDAKPPKGSDLPGGNAVAFDWRLLTGRDWPKPWLLAGGLHAGNVVEAMRISGATGVDTSSGVESAPGIKDNDKIAAFVQAALSA